MVLNVLRHTFTPSSDPDYPFCEHRHPGDPLPCGLPLANERHQPAPADNVRQQVVTLVVQFDAVPGYYAEPASWDWSALVSEKITVIAAGPVLPVPNT